MNSFLRGRRSFVLLVLAIASAGCGSRPEHTETTGPPRVVASFSILGDLVKNVAGDRVILTTLVGADGDAHTFEPTPQDAKSLANADLIFAIGAGFEPWLVKLRSASGSKAQRIEVSKGIHLLEGCCELQGKGENARHDHDETDPHIWFDVKNASHMVGVIRDSLVRHDPAGRSIYEANATAYLAKLNELDSWVREQAALIPEQNRNLITSHDTFGYFAKAYGFRVAGTVLGSFSTEAADPSAAEFAKLVAIIKKEKTPAIFAENVHNPKLVQRLAQEAGVKVGPPLFTDALGPPGSSGDTYINMIRYDTSAIVESLKQ